MSNEPTFTPSEIKVLNTNLALKYMLQSSNPVSPEKALRYVNYEKTLEELQIELIEMQKWIIKENKRLCILFEGRDAAGKGGAIRRIVHHLNPRHYRVIALPKPTEIEKGQWYFQRYSRQLPNPGEIVLFDRSWYNRAVVEPVNGFCSEEEYERFMNEVNGIEESFTADGIMLIKLYFSITKDEQARRFADIKNDPLKRWKMSPVDDKAQELWDVYTGYKERMFEKTNTKNNPWVIIQGNKKPRARSKAIRHILKTVPYEKT